MCLLASPGRPHDGRGEHPAPFLKAEDFPTRDSIRARWDEIESGWRAYIAALTDDQLEQPLVYTGITGGARREQILWEGLAQIVNHATDHRAQTLALSTKWAGARWRRISSSTRGHTR